MKMEQTKCSETSAYKIQTQGNFPEENIQHTEHGESLKSRSLRDKTQISQETDIRTPGGIRTPNSRHREAVDPRFRPRCHMYFKHSLFLVIR